MKKIIPSIIAAILPLFALLSSAQAQDVAANSRTAAPRITMGSPAASPAVTSAKSTKELRKEEREKKQFNRITQRFVDEFEDAANITWEKNKNGYSGSFTRDGVRNMVWYNQSGEVTHLLITYTEQRLAPEIKTMVKKAYKGYQITSVHEIHQDDNVVYLVTVENDSNIKQVTVCNGEMNIYKAFNKAL